MTHYNEKILALLIKLVSWIRYILGYTLVASALIPLKGGIIIEIIPALKMPLLSGLIFCAFYLISYLIGAFIMGLDGSKNFKKASLLFSASIPLLLLVVLGSLGARSDGYMPSPPHIARAIFAGSIFYCLSFIISYYASGNPLKRLYLKFARKQVQE